MLSRRVKLKKWTILVTLTRNSDQPADPATAQVRSNERLRLNLRQLEVFVATARAGSTRGAADRVARSQSAASAALTELEAVLGAPLFDRVRRRLVINVNGRTLLPKAAALLDQVAEVQQLFAGAAAGTGATPLRVAASLTIGEVLLPDIVALWKQTHTDSPVQIVIGNTSEVIRRVADFDVDLGFIEGPQTHPDLRVRPWLTDDMVLVAAPTHPLARKRRVDVAALRSARWALREPGSGSREAVDRWLLEHVGSVEVGFEFGSTEAIKRLLTAGAALGCVSRLAVASALADGSLKELRTGLPAAARKLGIVVHRDKRLGRGAEDFLRLCAEAMKS